jgi:molybdopterin/thiamine biosynthesis adenylyltransferase/molybdopterin converting factor small subunit
VDVYIPAPFRRLTGDRTHVEGHGSNVRELLEDVETQYPGFRGLLFNEQREVPAHINVYLNNRDIHSLQGLETPVREGDQLAVIPAMAGGAQDDSAPDLTPEQMERYARHIVLPHWGAEGQRKLARARVVVVGTGGLGSPVLMYLAGAGVGTLGIVEFDVAEVSNLPRQILHHMHDLGRPKALSARESLADNNPEVKVILHQTRLASDNALDILSGYDIVVAAVDNFPARYLMNDACVFLEKPLIEGSILGYEGQATVFLPGKGCYRCLYPTPPPPGLVPTPAEAGVLSMVPAIIGPVQAVEAVKLILGIGESLNGRLLLFDALSMEFHHVRIRRDPNCAVCGDNPTVTKLIDYEAFCGAPADQPAAGAQGPEP